MYHPLTVKDFLDRAESVYPDRVGVVDEPDPPAPDLGAFTYRLLAALARAQAPRLDQLGVPTGGRVAVLSQNSARLLTSFFGVSAWGRILVPVNFRLAQPEIDYINAHSGARVVYADPTLKDCLDARSTRRTSSCSARTSRSICAGSNRSPGQNLTRRQPRRSTTPRAPRRGPRACN